MSKAWLLLLTLLCGPALAEDAKTLNTKGFRLYQAKKYGDAIEAFKAAIAADPNHALAHYNLGATYGVLRKLKKVCQHDAYRSAVLEPLEKSIALDPLRRARAKKDADFDAVKDTVRYQAAVMERPLTDEKNVRPVLEAVSFYAQSQGIYGPPAGLDFRAKGRVSAFTMALDPETDQPKRTLHRGRFTVEGRKVTIVFDKPLAGQTTFEGTLNERGVLALPAPFGEMTDDDDECSA